MNPRNPHAEQRLARAAEALAEASEMLDVAEEVIDADRRTEIAFSVSSPPATPRFGASVNMPCVLGRHRLTCSLTYFSGSFHRPDMTLIGNRSPC